MAEYISIAKVGEIPEGEGRSYPIAGRMVAVFHANGEYYAINDTCPHMGASLATGHLEQEAVTCPWHAWRFSIKDGTWLDNPNPNLATDSYEVRVVGDDIQVRLPEGDGPPPEGSSASA